MDNFFVFFPKSEDIIPLNFLEIEQCIQRIDFLAIRSDPIRLSTYPIRNEADNIIRLNIRLNIHLSASLSAYPLQNLAIRSDPIR